MLLPYLKPGMSRSRIVFFFILISGLILRLGSLFEPVTYDEAYTYVGFASRSLWPIVSDYSLPNNHIFHSLLVHLSTQIVGNHPWAIRLPALLAGLGVIWMVYILGKELYSRETGLAAAALAAYFPELIHFSTDARGYSLIGLFTLLIFWLGLRLTRQPTTRDWILLALCTALGFWTIPLMLYPAGGLYLWLFLELSLREITTVIASERLLRTKQSPAAPGDSFARQVSTGSTNGSLTMTCQWLLSGLGAGILTVLLYTPVLLVSGWRKLLANGFVQPVNAKEYFDWILLSQITETLKTWTREVPLALTLILALGFFLSLALHWRIQATRWPLPLVLSAWITLLLLTRRPDAYDRFWSWLITPILLWAAAGIVETTRNLTFIPRPSPKGRGARSEGESIRPATQAAGNLFPAILTGLAVLGLATSLAVSIPTFPEKWTKMGNPEASALYLKDNLQPGDAVLAGYPNNAPLWYYLSLYGVPETAWQARDDFSRAYVLVAANQENQSLKSVIKSYKLDPAAFALERAEGLMRYGQILIYRVEKR
jgi:hypothetical protein